MKQVHGGTVLVYDGEVAKQRLHGILFVVLLLYIIFYKNMKYVHWPPAIMKISTLEMLF